MSNFVSDMFFRWSFIQHDGCCPTCNAPLYCEKRYKWHSNVMVKIWVRFTISQYISVQQQWCHWPRSQPVRPGSAKFGVNKGDFGLKKGYGNFQLLSQVCGTSTAHHSVVVCSLIIKLIVSTRRCLSREEAIFM